MGETSSSSSEDYYIVQFRGYILEEWKQDVRNSGATIFHYVPNNAFIVRMEPSVRVQVENLDCVQWVGPYYPSYSVSPVLISASEESGQEDIIVMLFDTKDNSRILNEISAFGGEIVDNAGGIIRVRIDKKNISDIAALNGVSWIEKYVQPVILNDVAADIISVSYVRTTHGLTGSGQIVAVADTGLDTGFNNESIHDDLEGRILSLIDLSNNGAADTHGHGTHVAGSVLGNGANSSGQFAGMAPEAQLVFQAIQDEDGSLGGIPTDYGELFQQAYDHNARIHTNSWGASVYGSYTSGSQSLDIFAWDHPNMLILFSAGNDGEDSNSDGVVDADSIGSPATAKNCLTVGSSENYRIDRTDTYGDRWSAVFPVNPIYNDYMANNTKGIAAFSSRGPTDDGRIKPDVVAPGTFIISTRSSVASGTGWGVYNDFYLYMGGTSMSTPIVAGSAALVRQYYVENESLKTPSAALLKATIINGANNMTPGQYGTGSAQEIQTRPDDAQGWGRVDIEKSLFPVSPRKIYYNDTSSTPDLNTSEEWNISYYVDNGSEPLKVTLVWTDYPSEAYAATTLVNNLDLIVIGSNDTYFGNGGSEPDNLNNVEQVELLSPDVGWYTINVKGTTIPQGPQPFALVLSGALYDESEAIYPVADFIANVTEGYVPLTVSFSDLSSDATSWSWDIDNDGTEDYSTQDIVHTYDEVGLYSVNLTVSNINGTASEVKADYINVTPVPILPVADFSTNVTEGYIPLTVSFSDLSSDATSWSWDIDNDGTEDYSTQNIIHTYDEVGLYSVNLTVSNINGTASEVKADYINVTPVPILPVADFSTNVTEGYVPLTVSFSDLSSDATSWSWDIDNDGTEDYSTQDIIHTYDEVDLYSVNLTVSNVNGTASEVKVNYINVTPVPILPVADFSTNVTEGYVPLTVSFSDLSSDATSWSWDIDNDGTEDYSTQDIVHTYDEVGLYSVNLTVSNINGTDSELKVNYINVTAAPIIPVADFAAAPRSGDYPLEVQFTDLSINAANWSWNFGDGNTSTLQNPIHTYISEGTYNVSLNVSNSGDFDLAEKSNYITVSKPGSGTGSGGGSSGGGATGEAFENIAFKDVKTENIITGLAINYVFDDEQNPIRYINFSALKNSGRISTTIEVLKNRSSMVDTTVHGTVYSNLNIWVGKSGFATEDNIADPVIGFSVSKEWLSENDIDENSIVLYRYSEGKWNALNTGKIGEDVLYLYFEAETPGFSPFAIAAEVDDGLVNDVTVLTEEESGSINVSSTSTITETSVETGNVTESEKATGSGTNMLFIAILMIILLVLLTILYVVLSKGYHAK
ncbi:PKD domain-containing protein [Methanococcoides sp. LMO-2]|uniref:PKD domain-containing protein n=1 Tax=Methanococcoides cohabitans TaxID=3136559 RepID=A0ABU9KS50_9EURY